MGDFLKLISGGSGEIWLSVQLLSIMPQFLLMICLMFSESVLYVVTNTTLSFVSLGGFCCNNVGLSKSFVLMYTFLGYCFYTAAPESVPSRPRSMRKGDRQRKLNQRETFWIDKLQTTKHPGLNDDLDFTPFL